MRILIAEDMPETLADLNDLVLSLFPGAEVILAEDGDAAETAIRELIHRRQRLDIAILDNKMPYHGVVKGTSFLCSQIATEMPRTLVAHVTAFEDEPGLPKHMEHMHASGVGERGLYVLKTGNWGAKLKQGLAAFKVDEDLEALLREEPERAAIHSCASDLAQGQFTKEVERLWRYLPESTRRRVQRYFTVEPIEGRRVRVVLGGLSGI
jgi:CheY-like chemotaxis protein